MSTSVLTVSQLSRYLRSIIEGDMKLANVYVSGEISNYKLHILSGNAYFSLKDENSLIRCMIFGSCLEKLKFTPEDGMKVVCFGKVTVYEKNGDYQLRVMGIKPDGIGELALSYEQLKAKLEAEGLFDPAKKRPLPRFPKKIAAVTSSSGAAIRDICNVIGRRYPICELTICPTLVQGADAPADICRVLSEVYKKNFDVIIVGRGGGSAEDLSAFSDERVVRCVAASPVPIISAVGHETDFSLSDFAADRRAATPSVAAELAVPDRAEIRETLYSNEQFLKKAVSSRCYELSLRIDALTRSTAISVPEKLISPHSERLDKLTDSLTSAYKKGIETKEKAFERNASKLDVLSPLKTLSRGYSAVMKDGKAVTSVNDVHADDLLNVRLADGKFDCKVI